MITYHAQISSTSFSCSFGNSIGSGLFINGCEIVAILMIYIIYYKKPKLIYRYFCCCCCFWWFALFNARVNWSVNSEHYAYKILIFYCYFLFIYLCFYLILLMFYSINNGDCLHKIYWFNVPCANNMPKYTMQISTHNLVTKSVKESKETKIMLFIEIKRFTCTQTQTLTHLWLNFFSKMLIYSQ